MNRTHTVAMKRLFMPVVLVVGGLLLMAASASDHWLENHWQRPQATTASAPHNWSQLEKNLHPEACAQCHQQQFDDWKRSRHAHAFSPGMVGQFAAMGSAAANDCLTCHAPLEEQKFVDDAARQQSLTVLLNHPSGFQADGDVDSNRTPLTHAGVSCASCHVRHWQRFGPPVRGDQGDGHVDGVAHGGFTAKQAFVSSEFCASCHQFPSSYAINGKPLENTLFEWKQSRFFRQGVSCQQCHMPDRQHQFRGIHDAETVLSGLTIQHRALPHGAELLLHSTAIGHAFPTYVTPQVVVTAEALIKGGEVVKRWHWTVGRDVAYRDGWQELRDHRIQPDEKRSFVAADAPAGAIAVRFVVTVEPDHFYKGVYRGLLDDESTLRPARSLLQRALDEANRNDYTLFRVEVAL